MFENVKKCYLGGVNPAHSNAFTLAEVLITLGIIGVVAALTLPSVIQNHQKQVTVNKLKAFNSTMSQAFQIAEKDYGTTSGWDGINENNITGEVTYNWLSKYLLPYIQYTEAYYDEKYAYVGLKNGMGFTAKGYNVFLCFNFDKCKKVPEEWNSRDRFIFRMVNNNIPIQPYTSVWDGTRENLIDGNSSGHGCTKGCARNKCGFCAKLIQYDGWQIKEDYPW
jgi:prepilin-type N-terminal cleavage/methylation domain-containing protein